jgi:AbrB family looped-hinge helix DNA binding protein
MAKEKTYSVYEVKGQLRVTIPKALATALNINKGDRVKWIIDRGDLILRKV